jgi:hypothetical protein
MACPYNGMEYYIVIEKNKLDLYVVIKNKVQDLWIGKGRHMRYIQNGHIYVQQKVDVHTHT